MLLLFLTGISLIRTLKYPVIGDDETPLQVKVTPVCFIVYVAADSFGYLTETLTFIYKVIGNVSHIVTVLSSTLGAPDLSYIRQIK